jgi:CheY-like chemotaxis protein
VKKIAERDGMCRFRFTVQDTGIGISEEQQQRLFVLFEQADGGFSRKFGGAGLGLTIAKRIVDMMDGRIWVESALGKGAAFIVEVSAKAGARAEASLASPDGSAASADADQQAREAKNGVQGDPACVTIFAGKRIMVAEDGDINREIISALLEHTGVEIDFAFDGADAVAKFFATPAAYDAILMDIHMPGLDGYEAAARIRASGMQGARAIPIIAVTANVFREDIERCLAAGMNSHLGKPIHADLLVAELKKHLR